MQFTYYWELYEGERSVIDNTIEPISLSDRKKVGIAVL